MTFNDEDRAIVLRMATTNFGDPIRESHILEFLRVVAQTLLREGA